VPPKVPKRDASSAPLLPRIRATLPTLQASDARVAQAIIDDPESAIYRSASEIASIADTSTATVVRCAQKLGFRGFHDLKLALARDQATFRSAPGSGHTGEDDGNVLAQVTAAGAQTVRDATALVDPEAFDAAVSALHEAGRILFVGVGTSGPLAQDAAYRFRAVGLIAEAPADVHVQHVAARLLGPGDVCTAISHTGSTRETLEIAAGAKAAGATTIAVASYISSPLNEVADIVLTAGTREVSFRLEAMASRLAHMAVLDALLVAVADREPERSQAALDIYADVLSEHRY
jgi:RpiR family transcriptional regulator, carbohydrate utilization regulator